MKNVLFFGIICSLIFGVGSPALALEDDDIFWGVSFAEQCTPDKGYRIDHRYMLSKFPAQAQYIIKINNIDLCKEGLSPDQALRKYDYSSEASYRVNTVEIEAVNEQGKIIILRMPNNTLQEYKNDLLGNLDMVPTEIVHIADITLGEEYKPTFFIQYLKNSPESNYGTFKIIVTNRNDQPYGTEIQNKIDPRLEYSRRILADCSLIFKYEEGKKILKAIHKATKHLASMYNIDININIESQ